MRGTISSNGLSTIRMDLIFGGLWTKNKIPEEIMDLAVLTILVVLPCQVLILKIWSGVRCATFGGNRTHFSNLHDIWIEHGHKMQQRRGQHALYTVSPIHRPKSVCFPCSSSALSISKGLTLGYKTRATKGAYRE